MAPKSKDISAYTARIQELESLLRIKNQELNETNTKLNTMQLNLDSIDIDNKEENNDGGNDDSHDDSTITNAYPTTTTTTTNNDTDPNTTATADPTITITDDHSITEITVDDANVKSDPTVKTSAAENGLAELSFRNASKNYNSTKIPNFKAFEDVTDDINTFRISARQWLTKTEDVFILNNTPESDKSILASFSLTDSAYAWYETARANCTSTYLPWVDFKELFMQYAVPGADEIIVYDKFNVLNWKMSGNMDVGSYVRGFWQYKNGLTEAEGDGMAMARFMNGLSNNIRMAVINKKPLTLAQAINIAYATEAARNMNGRNNRDDVFLFRIDRSGRIKKFKKHL